MPAPLASGSKAATLIIQKGLACGILNYDVDGNPIPPGTDNFLSFGAGITPFFSLYIENPTIPQRFGTGGGSRVYAPGEIATMYQPVDPDTGHRVETGQRAEDWYVVPRDKEADYFRKNKAVTIKFNFAGKEVEKIYSVSESRAHMIIEVIKFVNMTKQQMSVAISGIKKITNEAVVTIGKLRVRNKPNK